PCSSQLSCTPPPPTASHTLSLHDALPICPHSRVPVGKYKIGQIAQERQPHLTNAVVGDPRVGDQEWAKREGMAAFAGYPLVVDEDRKSTRLNSSHVKISYAVFCLKKKHNL